MDVARAILKGSKILVTDEPLSNLDPDSGATVMELLSDHRSDGGVVVYSSIEPSEVECAEQVIETGKTRVSW